MSKTINLEGIKRINIESKHDEIKLNVTKSEKSYFELEEDLEEGFPHGKIGEDGYFIRFSRSNDSFLNKFFGFISNKTLHVNLYLADNFEELKVNFVQGDVNIKDVNLNYFENKIITGNTRIKKSKIKNHKSKLITGNFLSENSDFLNDEISVTTGNIKYEDSKIQNIDCHLITGNLDISKMNSDFDLMKITVITGEAMVNICGKEPIYITKKLTPYSSTLKSNVDLIEKQDVELSFEKRRMVVKVITGNLKIRGIESKHFTKQKNDEKHFNSTNTEEKIISDDFLTQEEKKILELFKQEKISYDFAIELLSEIGYNKDDAEKFLKKRGASK
ncbi:DUF4097 family beta strand repeat-containing protein [Geotoga petraea]|jgi:hypothetical protein|uniref:Putative adhesin n=1 Tax=Geotoga petraea TaxID=28234 RepID=A0A1G6IBY4_9BACT|nr:DUF4097 family beta strand repeat-containing protein [Geotoga petraea]MDK2945608.1 hypothetical protein [Geotoga sp.]TGG89161.1 hypothetical protein E4650_02920 [Geotoga petraea]SDC04049.1 Putative adhesin [Geotoga petraea]